jgi:hypothetical protein
MDEKDFVSKPNSCHGCPLEKIAPEWAKIGNICGSVLIRYEVDYRLDDLGRQICTVKEREAKA